MQITELASHFAIYEGGGGYVLPNVLPEIAREVCDRVQRGTVETALSSLRAPGADRFCPQELSSGRGLQSDEAFWPKSMASAGGHIHSRKCWGKGIKFGGRTMAIIIERIRTERSTKLSGVRR
jgi:hypothetical protein